MVNSRKCYDFGDKIYNREYEEKYKYLEPTKSKFKKK